MERRGWHEPEASIARRDRAVEPNGRPGGRAARFEAGVPRVFATPSPARRRVATARAAPVRSRRAGAGEPAAETNDGAARPVTGVDRPDTPTGHAAGRPRRRDPLHGCRRGGSVPSAMSASARAPGLSRHADPTRRCAGGWDESRTRTGDPAPLGAAGGGCGGGARVGRGPARAEARASGAGPGSRRAGASSIRAGSIRAVQAGRTATSLGERSAAIRLLPRNGVGHADPRSPP